MRAEAEVQSNDIQAIKEKLRFPYCEIDDPKFMEVMSLQKTVQYYHDKELGKKRSSEDSRTQKRERHFQEFVEAVDLLYETIQKHPYGLFLCSISNVVLFYNLSVLPYIDLEDRKAKLYPKMNFILTHALMMGFSVNEIVARHFVLKEDQDKYNHYLEHLRIHSPQVKVEEGNYIEYKNLFKFNTNKKLISTCLADFLLTIENIILLDSQDLQIQVLQEHRALWEVSGKQTILIKGSEVTGNSCDLIDYAKYFSAEILKNQEEAEFYLGSQNQKSFEEWRLKFARYKDELPHSVFGLIDYLSLMTKEVYKIEVDYTQIIRDKFTNMLDLLQSIIVTHGSKESDDIINNDNFCNAFLGLFRRYFVSFRGEQKALEQLLNNLYVTLDNEEIKKNVTYNILSTFSELNKFSKSREFVNYRENFKILTKVIIQHVPLFLLSSVHFNKGNSQLSEAKEFVIPQLLFDIEDEEGRRLLYQAILSQNPKSYDLYCDQISYCVVSPDSPLYQKIVEENPEMKKSLHNILFAKLRSFLKKSNSSFNAKGIKHLYETLDNLDNDELRGFLESLKQLELKESKILKDFLLGAEEDGKIRHNNFSGRLFSQFFTKGLYEIIDLVNASLPSDKHRDYFLKQSFVFLLDGQKYSELSLFKDVKLSNGTNIYDDKELEDKFTNHVAILDRYSIARITRDCSDLPKVQEVINMRKAANNKAKEEAKLQAALYDKVQELEKELESKNQTIKSLDDDNKSIKSELEKALKQYSEEKNRVVGAVEEKQKLQEQLTTESGLVKELQMKLATLHKGYDRSSSENSDLKQKLASKRDLKDKKNTQIQSRLNEMIEKLREENNLLKGSASNQAAEAKENDQSQEVERLKLENQRLQGVIEEFKQKESEKKSQCAEVESELQPQNVNGFRPAEPRVQDADLHQSFNQFWQEAVEKSGRFFVSRNANEATITAVNVVILQRLHTLIGNQEIAVYMPNQEVGSIYISDFELLQDLIKERYSSDLRHNGVSSAVARFCGDIDNGVVTYHYGQSFGFQLGYNAGYSTGYFEGQNNPVSYGYGSF